MKTLSQGKGVDAVNNESAASCPMDSLFAEFPPPFLRDTIFNLVKHSLLFSIYTKIEGY